MFGVTVTLTLRPSPAHAQMETFVQAVRELAEAAGQPEPTRSNGIRTAANRMGTALVDGIATSTPWKRGRPRDLRRTGSRAYRLHVELGVAYRARGRLADALREFDAAGALRPSASDVQVLRALTLEAAGRSEEAGRRFGPPGISTPQSSQGVLRGPTAGRRK